MRLLRVPPAAAGGRLDRCLVGLLPAVSRSRIQAAIRSGQVLLNGTPAKASESVRAGDEILWRESPPARCDEYLLAQKMPLEILYEDDFLAVLNKPAGVIVHPGAGQRDGTLVSGLLHHFGKLSDAGGVDRPGIVHRLDKETSGCLIVAKTDAAHRSLAAQFAGQRVSKTYLALVSGTPRWRSGVVDAPIGRHPVNRKKMAVSPSGRGRAAVTEYHLLDSTGEVSLLECRPRTGRTHQIRVHLKHLGCPVLGDSVYGRRGNFSRHMLHAWKLQFQHPIDGRSLAFEAAPPPEFRISSRWPS
jgi:23S rRNA pseudouridine1911/1915/1917 synthase